MTHNQDSNPAPVDIIAGRQPVLEALKAGRPLNRVLLARDVRRHSAIAEILQLAQQARIPVEFVPVQAIDNASGATLSQGVVAYAAARDYVALDDLLAVAREAGEPCLLCLLDGIEDPHNLGAILRTADATGVHGVVIRSRRAVGLTTAVAKASAGAVEYVSVARVPNIAQSIEQLKKENVWVTGIDAAGELDYTGVDYTGPTAIVIGGEGGGLSDLVRKRCDMLARIPMRGHVTSLNASVAAALVMYEALRRRGEHASHDNQKPRR